MGYSQPEDDEVSAGMALVDLAVSDILMRRIRKADLKTREYGAVNSDVS